MKKYINLFFIAVAAVCAISLPACAEPWSMDEFTISIWTHEDSLSSGEKAAIYRDAHINTVMASVEQMSVCEKYGLRVIVRGATPEFAAEHKDDPVVWGWFVRDEPKEDEYEQEAAPVKAFQDADPNHPAYVNMVSSYDVDSFFKIVDPRIMSYDYYQWWWGTFTQFYFLDKYRQVAVREKVPLLVWVEVNADPKWEYGKPGAGYPPDNEVKLRQSVFTALAYGAKGIQWFVDSLFLVRGEKHGVLLPELSRAGEDVKTISADLEALGPELINLNSDGVFHTSPPVYEANPLPKKDWWAKVKGHNITVGQFSDAAGRRYALVVNRDIENAQKCALKFDGPVKSISRFDRAVRAWNVFSDNNVAGLEIAPGDGELIRID